MILLNKIHPVHAHCVPRPTSYPFCQGFPLSPSATHIHKSQYIKPKPNKNCPFCIVPYSPPLPAPKKKPTPCSTLRLHQNMRIRSSGSHPPQRSLSPPPDLLSSMLQEEPPSPPPYKPSIFSPTKAKMMTTPPSSSPFDQQAPHVMVSRINARLSSNIDNGADSKDIFFKTSRFFAQDDETTTDHSWCMSTNER